MLEVIWNLPPFPAAAAASVLGLVPPAVRGKVGGAIEDLLALGAAVLDVDDHGAPERERRILSLLVSYLQAKLEVICMQYLFDTEAALS